MVGVGRTIGTKEGVRVSRRQMLIGFCTAVVAALAHAASRAWAACAVTTQETEGPYWVDELLNRSDITVDPSDGSVTPGVPLALTINVLRADADCAPAAGAQVDIWHCNAEGRYSDTAQNDTVGQMFLRGYQITNADGAVRFQTIYPGWYQGRTIHIHVRVRAFDGSTTTTNFTTQIYFDEAVSSQVIVAGSDYDHGARDTFNTNDSLYMAATEIVLTGDESSGLSGAIDIALNGLPAGTAAACGDADGSGDVTVTDGVQSLRGAAGLSSDCTVASCDVDGSGAVTVSDGVRILRVAAGLPVHLECL